MANEYATLDALKLQLGIVASDTTRDALLNQKLSSASRGIDAHCGGRRFYADTSATPRTYRTRDRVVRDPDGDLIYVDDISAVTGLVVEVRSGYGSGATWAAVTDYLTEPDNALAKGVAITSLRRDQRCWNTDQLRVTAKWGWPAIPDVVVEATLLQAGRLVKRKDSPEGVSGSADWGAIRVARIDPDVQEMLANLVLPAVG